MNNPNPFIPQGSLLEQKNKKRARVKVAVFSIFAVNILVILPLLIQGCGNKEKPADETASLSAGTATNISSAPDTNTAPPSLPSVTSTSAPPATMSNTMPVATPPPPPPAPEVPATTEYVVLKGDSFYTIAQKFHLKMKDVEAANPNVQPTKLKAGQKIQVPAGASGAGATANTPGTNAMSDSGGETTYVVKPKDTLTKIAKEFGTTVKALRALNSLKIDAIKAGQKLKVPSKAAPVEPAPTPAPTPAPVSTPAVVPPPSAPPAGITPGR
jgi:LysM repeat protein